MSNAHMEFVDTTFRDGVQSLWAMNLRTVDLRQALLRVEEIGFDQIEVMAPGGAFKKFVRHLAENPWDYVHAMVDAIKPEQLRWHGRFQGYAISGNMHTEVGHLMIKRIVDLGINKTRIGDNWNQIDVVKSEKETLENLGMHAIVNLMYSVSDRHTDEYFVDRAAQLAAFNPYRICFKDVGGLLTTERAKILLPKIRGATGAIPLEFHAHCNNGMAPLNSLIAAEVGFSFLHTSLPPLANGSSQPSLLNVADNLRCRAWSDRINFQAARETSARFDLIAEKNKFPRGEPREFEEKMYRHQVPGGMISNLVYQLRLVGKEHLLPSILDEAALVRRDFGYPIMVTPLSQFVGSQAAINVIVGKRYKQVSDDVIHYAWGRHGGSEAIEAMDPEVRSFILDRPRGRELEHFSPPDLPLEYFREKYGPVSDEELILRAIVGDDAMSVVMNGARARLNGDKATHSFVNVLRNAVNGSKGSLGHVEVRTHAGYFYIAGG